MALKIYFHGFVVLTALLSAGVCLAQESSISDADDCSEISVDFDDVANLTRQERIELMDRALLNSLSKYERCQKSHSSSASGSGTAGDSGQISSSASASMTGTSAPSDQDVSEDGESTATALSSDTLVDESSKTGKKPLGSGKVPDDIPPADNDSILEEQIRQAAMNETDPVIKAKLWNEYRKYKGLPVVDKR